MQKQTTRTLARINFNVNIMSEFRLYIDLGLFHILDFSGYDHMIFVIAISAIYSLNDWRKVLVLITAFTIGHSITLALATLELIEYDVALIEFLIPLTILITACLLYTSPSPRDGLLSRMPSSA